MVPEGGIAEGLTVPAPGKKMGFSVFNKKTSKSVGFCEQSDKRVEGKRFLYLKTQCDAQKLGRVSPEAKFAQMWPSGRASRPPRARLRSGSYKLREELRLEKMRTASEEKEKDRSRWCLPGRRRAQSLLLSHSRGEK